MPCVPEMQNGTQFHALILHALNQHVPSWQALNSN